MITRAGCQGPGKSLLGYQDVSSQPLSEQAPLGIPGTEESHCGYAKYVREGATGQGNERDH